MCSRRQCNKTSSVNLLSYEHSEELILQLLMLVGLCDIPLHDITTTISSDFYSNHITLHYQTCHPLHILHKSSAI